MSQPDCAPAHFILREVSWHRQDFSLHSALKCCTQSSSCVEIGCLLPHRPSFSLSAIFGLLVVINSFSGNGRVAAVQNIGLCHVACNTFFSSGEQSWRLTKELNRNGIQNKNWATSPIAANSRMWAFIFLSVYLIVVFFE